MPIKNLDQAARLGISFRDTELIEEAPRVLWSLATGDPEALLAAYLRLTTQGVVRHLNISLTSSQATVRWRYYPAGNPSGGISLALRDRRE